MTKSKIIGALFLFQTIFAMDTQLALAHRKASGYESIEKRSFFYPEMPAINLALLPLQKIPEFLKKLSAISAESVDKAIKAMSPDISLLYHIATILPEIKYRIIFLMLDKDTPAIERFYEKSEKSIMKALRRYRTIKKDLGTSDKPVGPLYALSRGKRDIILKELNPSYYPYPIITKATEKKIHKMEQLRDIYDIYAKGKEVMVVPNEVKKDCAQCLCMVCNSSLLCGAIMCGGGTVIGACTKYGALCVCTRPMLNLICQTSLCIGMSIGICMGCKCGYTNANNSGKKVL